VRVRRQAAEVGSIGWTICEEELEEGILWVEQRMERE
jgi:hypothetical protein